MKKLAVVLGTVAIGVVPISAFCGDVIVSANQLKAKITIGTAVAFKGFAIDIVLTDALPANVEIDQVKFREDVINLELRSKLGDKSVPFDPEEILAKDYAIQAAIRARDFSEGDLDVMQREGTYVHSDRPLRVPLTNGDVLVISPAALKEVTESIVILSETEKDKLVAAKGGAHTLYKNRFDFAAEVGTPDSTRREYVVTFGYYKTPFEKMKWWAMYASGYLSTNSKSPHTKLELYPLSIGTLRGLNTSRPFRTFEVRASAGVKGDQRLATARASEAAYLTMLLPNFIDLTGGEERLRLKPVVAVGGELWQEIDDGAAAGDTKSGGKLGANIYYYIPMFDKYSVLVEGELSAPFGGIKDKYDTHDTLYRFDITLGYQLPLASTKVVAKYSLGANDVTFTEDSTLLIGLAADLFNVGGGVVRVTR